MKIYRISQDGQLSELMEEARRYDSPEDFASAYSVKQNLSNYDVPINEDGTVTLYHTTSPEIITKIKEEGVFQGSNAPTGGMTGLALDPSAFFGWDKEWVGNTWGSVDNIIEIKVPHQY
ncbi:unnamed protein product, partial [marine sediment metagenome]